MSDTQLLCTFTYKSKVDETVREIQSNYELSYGKIFVLQNMRDPEEIFCTYNIEQGEYKSYLDKTISIHRKRETNTLYTINALNELIKYLNDGMLDKSFPIPWDQYENSLLVTDSVRYHRNNRRRINGTKGF